ncbi:MAG: type I-U CRISPR-associated protein Csx17 [Pyrinomonadaceae bacterium]
MTSKILLRGCAPEPLIHYLKALGVMRLVAEQLDKNVRGAWTADGFLLETTATEDDLIDFFLNKYEPTPIVAPWNGGSGFYDGDDTSGIDAILSTKNDRIKNYRETINQIFALPELPSVTNLTLNDFLHRIETEIEKSPNKDGKEVQTWQETVDKIRDVLRKLNSTARQEVSSLELGTKRIPQIDEIKSSIGQKEITKILSDLLQPLKKLRTITKKFERSSGKDIIVQACRNRLSEECVHWIDAAVVLSESNAESPLLGSGGNDGRTDFTKAFMLHLEKVLPDFLSEKLSDVKKNESIDLAEKRLRASLFAGNPVKLENALIGQYHPAGYGGVNSSEGVSGNSFVNSWDYILGIEGALVLASATVRQLAAGARSKASFPFMARSSAIGYGTATKSEDTRGEIWLPLWSRSAAYTEIAQIFKEGRVQFRQSQKKVFSGFDFARAIADFGVDRGIDAFQRYVFANRVGKSFLATPVNVFQVEDRPLASLLFEFDRWLDNFRRATGDAKKTPPRFVRAAKNIEEASFKLCADGSEDSLREVFIALGMAEREISNGARFRDEKFLSPLTNLSTRWAKETKETTHYFNEFQIAQALASVIDADGKNSLRENLESVKYNDKNRVLEWSGNSTSAVWSTGNLAENLSNVLNRRSIDARKNGKNSHPPLDAKRFASLECVAAFLNDETDDERFEEYLFALSLINWQKAEQSEPRKATKATHNLPRIYALLKLLFLPEGKFKRKDREEIKIKHEPSIVPLLRAGRIPDALEIAERRLKSSGVVPLTRDFYYPEEDSARLAAALLIPINQAAIEEIADLILPKGEEI